MKAFNILVPTDFSETGLKAFSAAVSLARLTGGTITPFHSYIPLSEIDGYFYMGLGVTAQLSNSDLDQMILSRLDEVAAEYVPDEFRRPSRIGIGSAASAIENVAKEYDLIVMGSHGRSGVSRFIMGSVTEKVLRIVPTPVLVVRQNAQTDAFNRILLPLDVSMNSLSVIAFVRNLMAHGNMQTNLLHVVTTEDYNDDKNARIQANLQEDNLRSIVETHLKDYSDKVTVEAVVSRNPAYEEIIRRAEEGSYDLIAMTRVGKSALSYLTLGSTTANVIRGSEIPVISVRPPSVSQD